MNQVFSLMRYAISAVFKKVDSCRYMGVLFLLLALALFPIHVRAQATASLVGTVHDTSGAIIAGATVTAKNQETGFTRTSVSDADGNYVIHSVPIGVYTLTAEIQGFKQVKVPNITLDVAQEARVNLALVPGEVTTTVTVTDTTSLIQTESSSLGQVINNKEIVNLPLNSRHVTQLVELTPGALTSPAVGSANSGNAGPSAGSNTNFMTAAIGGGGISKTEFVLDGVTNTEQLYNGIQFEPSVDFIQEFRVLSNSFPAQYGRGSAVVLMGTKSGTNDLHGTGFEFIRLNTPGFQTDAKNFFAAPNTPLASLRQNQFGGSLGGPVLKSRLFFFLNYEGTRQQIPTTKSQLVPDTATRGGDLTNVLGATPAHDPYTGLPFPGNKIPSNELDAAAQFFLNPDILPLPNQPDGRTFVYSPAQTLDVDQGNVRIDYQIGSNDQLFGRFSITDSDMKNPGGIPVAGGTTATVNTKNAAVSYAHIFSPKLFNEVHFGLGRLYFANTPQGLGTNYTTQAGILGFDETSKLYPGFPTIFPGDYGVLWGNIFAPLINPTETYQLSDLVTWNKGKHALTMGFDMRHFHLSSTNAAFSRGMFFFNGQYTGNGFADFLTGNPSSGLRDFPRNTFGETDFSFPLFVQDDWRVSDNLTLNLGLRYDLAAAPVQDLGQNSYFDENAGKWIVSVYKNGLPNLTTQGIAQDAYNQYASDIITAKQAGLSNNLQTISKKTFAPRIGFAYRPFGGTKTVVRAGYGIFYQLASGNQTVSSAIINIPFIYDTSRTGSAAPAVPTQGGNFENFFNFPFGAGGGALVSQQDLSIHPPYGQQWNLAVQHELTPTLSLQLAYVGNKGTHIETQIPFNYPRWQGGINIGPQQPFVGEGTSFTNVGNSIYHALQATVEKRYSFGLYFLSNFTWSKLINDGSYDDNTVIGQGGVQDPANLRLDRGLGSQDVAFRSVTSAIYSLPFGRGMQFGHDIPRALDYAVGGWRLSIIARMQSGSPFTPTENTSPFGPGAGYGTRPNRVASGKLSHPTINEWFDVSAFTVNPDDSGVFGTSGRNILRGPGEDIWDASLMKDFHFTERTFLSLRLDAFNAFNHPWFAQPNANIQSGAGVSGAITSTATTTNSRELQGSLKIYF